MAEAALVEEMQVPNGGIADFVMSDEDIEAVYGPDDDGAEEYGTEGLGQFTDVANQMAAKGRYGDDLVAHVESGELVIPKEFLDRDPELKRSLFKYLEDHGIENPERYVVGSDANSINPETGMPEFFFKKIKKAIKKTVKKVAKIAKPVVKIIQKMAPVVLPIALSMTPLGPVFGAALGSGIASLINGGSIKDAFKSALISGAMGAAGAGVSGMMSGQGFMAGVGQAVSNPMARLGQTFTGAQNSLTRLVGGEVAANAPGFFSSYVPTTDADLLIQDLSTPDVLPKTAEPVTTAQAMQSAQSAPGVTPASYSPTQDPQAFAKAQFDAGNPAFSYTEGGQYLYNGQPIPSSLSTTQTAVPTQDIGDFMSGPVFKTGSIQPNLDMTVPTQDIGDFMSGPVFKTGSIQPNLDMTVPTQDIGDFMVGQKTQPGFLDKLQNYAEQGQELLMGPSSAQNIEAGNAAKMARETQLMEQYNITDINKVSPTMQKYILDQGQIAYDAAQPSLLRQYGPMAALGLGAAYVGGAFDTPETTTPGLIPQKTGSDLVEEDPYRYRTHDLGYQRLNPETGEYETVQNPYPDLGSYVVPTQYTYDLAPPTRPSGGPFRRPQPSLGDFPVGRPIEDPGFRPYPYDTVYNPNMVYQAAADGGPIFPRRNGGIMPDEGVPGKDSVRAMLMPGEFVMTTDAVRGAGGGNLNRGINNMYTVMRNLESRGRRIA